MVAERGAGNLGEKEGGGEEIVAGGGSKRQENREAEETEGIN